ncbi:hypothetical protein JCM8097_003568 [Rhodosporidiobolus ruineniae]
MPIKLYDLVSDETDSPPRYFSPACVRARLSLLAKGITDFQTIDVHYRDLRSIWTSKLEVEKATAPFIEREDGSLLMDSVEIALWLDKTYPDRQNLFLPEASLPVDTESDEYKAAVEDYHAHEKKLREGNPSPGMLVFILYARRIVQYFDKETAEYWVRPERLGEVETVKALRATLAKLSPTELPEGSKFVSSPSKPGLKDFSIYGSYRLLRSVSARFAAKTFEHPEAGEWPAWLMRMDELYTDGAQGLRVLKERDPKE